MENHLKPFDLSHLEHCEIDLLNRARALQTYQHSSKLAFRAALQDFWAACEAWRAAKNAVEGVGRRQLVGGH